MDDLHKTALQKTRTFVVKNLDLEEVQDQLESEVVTTGQMEIILSKQTKSERIRALLDALPRCGPHAFNKFIEILEENHTQRSIAMELRNKLTEVCKGDVPNGLLPPRPPAHVNREPIPDPQQADSSSHPPGTYHRGDGVPTSDSTKCYDKGTGRLLVINNYKFTDSPELHRDGSLKDARDLTETIEDFGFDNTVTYRNVKADDVEKMVKRFLDDDKTKDASCVICVILSHGGAGGQIYGYDEKMFLDKNVYAQFDMDAKGLQGKPKLVMFQCCRGDGKADSGKGDNEPNSSLAAPEPGDPQPGCSTPKAKDMLTVYATAEGEKSYRDEIEGARMIQEFCKSLKSDGKKEPMFDILTQVNNQVSDADKYPNQAQLMEIRSTLTKKWYLGE